MLLVTLPGWPTGPGSSVSRSTAGSVPGVPRVRLDSLLAERGLFTSRTRAAAAVMAGHVRLGPGHARAAKPGQLVEPDVELGVDAPPPYVSRGGVKLRNALDALGLDPAGRRCLDVGASTGGFTDCLLQAGAAHVVALDVAYGELDWSLREDERVTVIERSNARALDPSQLPYAPDLIVLDVSFISLRKVLPAVLACAAPRYDALAMVKPQFEVGRAGFSRGGVVREPEARRGALADVAECAGALGAAVLGFAPSGLPGPKGNLETFVWLAEGGRAARSPTSAPRSPRCRYEGRGHDPPAHGRLERGAARAAGGRTARREPRSPSTRRRRASSPSSPRRGSRSVCRGAAVPTSASCSAATGRSSPPCASTPARRCRCSRSTTARSASSPRSTPTGWGATSTARSRVSTRSSSSRPSTSAGPRTSGPRSTTSPSTASPACASPTSPTGSRGRRSGACAATASWSPPRRARRATTSPTAARSWPGACAATSSRSSRPHSLTARALVVAPDDLLTINNASREEAVEVHVDGRPACELPGGGGHPRRVRALVRDPGAAPGRELLPPVAGAVRAVGEVARLRGYGTPANVNGGR